jgi:hypothetical protein
MSGVGTASLPKSVSYSVWMDARLDSPFAVKRLLLMLLAPLPVAGALFFLGQGVLGLAVLAVGLWPLPFHCRANAGGLTISWLLVREQIPWADIDFSTLVEDARPGVVGKRKRVLLIERKPMPPVILRGRPHVLSAISKEIERFARKA